MRKWAALVAVAAFIVCTAQLAPPSSNTGSPVIGMAAAGLSTPTMSSLGFSTQYGSWSSTYSQSNVSGLGVNFADTTKESQAGYMGAMMAYPSSAFTFTAVMSLNPTAPVSIGIGPAASATGALEVLNLHYSASIYQADAEDWTAPQTFSATVASTGQTFIVGAPWLYYRVKDDGTNISYSCSYDGANWLSIYSVAKSSDFMSSNGGFHYLGVFIAPYNDAGGTVMLGYKLTKP